MKAYERIVTTGIFIVVCFVAIYLYATRNHIPSGLSEQISRIDKSIGEIERIQSEFNGQIEKLNTGFVSMGDEISRSRSSIESLGKGLSGVKTSISGFRTDLQQFRSGFPELEALANNSAREIQDAQRLLGEIKEGLK